MDVFEYLNRRVGEPRLARAEVQLLANLAQHPGGRSVFNKALPRFGEYEAAGYVRLAGARIGPLRIPDDEQFWATVTEAGCRAVAFQTVELPK